LYSKNTGAGSFKIDVFFKLYAKQILKRNVYIVAKIGTLIGNA